VGADLSAGSPVPDGLAALLERRWLLVGVGNDLRGDDAFGPLLARRLAGAGLPAIDAGPAPENLTGRIAAAAPEVLLLADAADWGGRVGDLRLVRPGELAGGSASTHDPGLGLLLTYLGQSLPDLDAWTLVAQAGSLNLGESAGPAIRGAVGHLMSVFLAALRGDANGTGPVP
jgi:hydrogenase 3 maturation protease